MKLFKGYVPTKNKKCMMKFKNVSGDELLTYEQVAGLPEYAGILAEDTVLIDIDDMKQSEILLNIVDENNLCCRVYETTKGMHFLFANNGKFDKCRTKINLACGIIADIKVGVSNSYEILKFDGRSRDIIYDIYDGEEYGQPPCYLWPVPCKTNFGTLKRGDGRNQSLFNYILTLQQYDFTNDEARDSIRMMNKYVLPESLDDDELETILRDEAFQKPSFYTGRTFRHDKFAKYLKNNSHIINISGHLHIYDDGVYKSDLTAIESEMIQHIPDLNRAKRSEVMSYLELLTKDQVEMAPANYIAFKNGIYDIESKSLIDFNPDIVITNKINFDYNPDAYSDITDKTLNKMACHDASVRALLEECIGYCFYRRNELRKCFILTGEKENGKSTFLSVIEHLLGKKNIASLDLKELGERFKTAELFGKLANIGDDIGDEFIPNPAIFKKLASGNPINVERKGKDPFDFSSYAKLLFSANNIPRIKDKSGAVISRLVIIPFDARFTPDDPDFDPYIKYKLIQDEPMQYLINIGLAGLERVLKNRKFTTSQKVEAALEEYNENNNPILLFFKEEPHIENRPTNAVYQDYGAFCSLNSFTPMSNIEFSKQVKKHMDMDIKDKTINGKKYRLFVKRGDGNDCNRL